MMDIVKFKDIFEHTQTNYVMEDEGYKVILRVSDVFRFHFTEGGKFVGIQYDDPKEDKENKLTTYPAKKEISNALRSCTRKMKEAKKKKDQGMWESWAAKREGLMWARNIVKHS